MSHPYIDLSMNKLLTLLPLVASAATLSAQQRPNILFCIADDASYHHFSSAGCSWVNTPNFDRVAREGLMFTNCYTPNAKSGPSRAVLLTGLYSWQLRNVGNHVANFPADIEVFTEALGRNGYTVAFTGKSWAPGNPGVVDGKPRQLTGKPYQSRKAKPSTSGISNNNYAANFADFLDANSGGDPWFFWFGSTEPHRRYEYGTGVRVGGKSTVQIERVPAFFPDCDTVRNDMLDYALEIEHYDKHIGLMLSELERRGMLNNTLIIITSDNGMPFPRAKANNYEYSHHMPCAMMWPAGINSPGRSISDYVNFVDIAPTVLDVAGVEWSKTSMQSSPGASLRPIMESAKEGIVVAERSSTLLGRERDDPGRPSNQGYPIRGIIRDGWLYIWNIKPHLYPAGNPETGYLDIDGSPTKTEILNLYFTNRDKTFYELSMGLRPAEELYDVRNDVDCMNNLASNPANAKRMKALRSELLKALRSHKDPRIVGDGDVFDRYDFDKDFQQDFYEKVMDGRLPKPWESTNWVSPTDYIQYKK